MMVVMDRCVDVFTPAEQAVLVNYWKENFAEKTLHYADRRLSGKCPLTPKEVDTFRTVHVICFHMYCRAPSLHSLHLKCFLNAEAFVQPIFRHLFVHMILMIEFLE